MGVRLLYALAAALAVLACNGSGDSEQKAALPINRCNTAEQCPAGTTCDSSVARCVTPVEPAGREYFLRINPSSSSSEGGRAQASQVFRVTLDESGQVTEPLVLKAPVNVDIELEPSAEDGTPAELTSADVVVADLGGTIPGEEIGVAIYRATTNSAFSNPKTQAFLVPGHRRYRITVLPPSTLRNGQSSPFPPAIWNQVTITSEGEMLDSDGELLETLELPEGRVTLTGRITRAGQPEEGVTIGAYDPASNALLSTLSTTGCARDEICNAFSVRLRMLPDELFLRVSRDGNTLYPVTDTPLNTAGLSELTTVEFGALDSSPSESRSRLRQRSNGQFSSIRGKLITTRRPVVAWCSNRPAWPVVGSCTRRSPMKADASNPETGRSGSTCFPASTG